MVTVCLDDPFLNSSGNPTGMYHIAGDNCPESSKSTVSVLDFVRERVGSNYSIADDIFTKDYLLQAGTAAYCTVHNEVLPYDPATFNIDDKTTWPTQAQWPGFDPEDESTWPVVETTEPEPYDPETFDFLNPDTWPTQEQWPGFDIEDSSTWPTPGGTPPGNDPWEPTTPGETTPPEEGEGGETTPTPSPTPGGTQPPEESYIPAA